MFHFCYYAPSTFLINMMGCWFCYSNSSASPFFLFSHSLTPSILPWAWRCHTADILLDPLKQSLVKPSGLQDFFNSLCRVRDPLEGICASEPCVATGTSCTSDLRPHHCPRAPVHVCPPKHRHTVCSQSYCTEAIIGTLEVTGRFTALSFYWLGRKIAATNLDLFYFNLSTTQEIKQGERSQTIRSLLHTRGRRKLPFSAWHGTDFAAHPPSPRMLRSELLLFQPTWSLERDLVLL